MKRELFSNDLKPNSRSQKLAEFWNNARAAVKPQASVTDLLLYDRIGHDYWDGGGLTHQHVTDWLAALPGGTDAIAVRINSPGGDVFEGIGIYNALASWSQAVEGRKITVHIDSLAASIASVIAMAGDEIVIAGNAMMMIHPASTITWGTADEHRQSAGVLDSIDATILKTYESRTSQKSEDIKGWMDAETYMTADQAVERGFADRAEALKTKQEPEPEPTPDNSAASRILAIRRAQALKRHHILSAHLRNPIKPKTTTV
jgi:ATP-dependent protease ClpP protease subunit